MEEKTAGGGYVCTWCDGYWECGYNPQCMDRPPFVGWTKLGDIDVRRPGTYEIFVKPQPGHTCYVRIVPT